MAGLANGLVVPGGPTSFHVMSKKAIWDCRICARLERTGCLCVCVARCEILIGGF